MEKESLENYAFLSPEAIEDAVKTGKLSQTIFAMGCFWGPDANFGSMTGVVQTRVGYAGASSSSPQYHDLRGHAEVVRVIFDRSLVSYRKLVGDFSYWYAPDRKGGQYRPILFIYDQDQRSVAKELSESIGSENSPEIIEAGLPKSYFWAAEEYHQKYRLRRNKEFVKIAELEFGPRWDEHMFFTKLNGDGKKGFNAGEWLKKLPAEMQSAYRVG